MSHLRMYQLLIGLLFNSCLFGQHLGDHSNDENIYNQFSFELDSLRKIHHIPGLAAVIVQDQKVAWSNGFGASHFDTGDGAIYRKVSADTPFWIASVTKTFLGLLFLQLEAEEEIDLNDKINDLPKWAGFCDWLSNSPIIFGQNLHCDSSIRIQHILNHTVNGQPGSQFLYNPIMYSRLSRYIEHIYGNPIGHAEIGHNKMAQLVQEKILGPADMSRTMSSQWQREKSLVFFDMAQGYKYSEGKFMELLPPERHLAGGAGIVSTVNDLAKYDIALDNSVLASKEVMDKLFSPAKAPTGSDLPYAFGWYVQEFQGEKLVWHGGWDEEAGFSALYLKIPARQLTFILLANAEGISWGNPLDQAAVERSAFAKLFIQKFASDAN